MNCIHIPKLSIDLQKELSFKVPWSNGTSVWTMKVWAGEKIVLHDSNFALPKKDPDNH